jgi:hypothetical protein
MSRPKRICPAREVFQVLNRAVSRLTIFEKQVPPDPVGRTSVDGAAVRRVESGAGPVGGQEFPILWSWREGILTATIPSVQLHGAVIVA